MSRISNVSQNVSNISQVQSGSKPEAGAQQGAVEAAQSSSSTANTAATPTITGSSAAGVFEPISPDDPKLKHTICPFMRSALKEGLIHVDGLGRAEVSQLQEVLGPFGKVTEFFARQNHAVDENGKLVESSKNDGITDFLRLNRKAEHYNPTQLAGSKGDHIGDSKILSVDGGFNAQRFDAFVSHSSDGKTMTAADFGKAVSSFQAKDQDIDSLQDRVLNRSKSAGEWALLINLLGKRDEKGELRVDIQEMRNLFEKNVFPEDWVDRVNTNGGKAPWRSWTSSTTSVLHHATVAKPRDIQLNSTADMAKESLRHIGAGGASLQGIGLALGQTDTSPSLVRSLEGTRQGVCPVGGNAAATAIPAGDLAQIHKASQSNG